MKKDKRPDPKPRKNALLWQSYLWWHESMEQRKRHNLRIASIEAGKSNLDAEYERAMMNDLGLEANLKNLEKILILSGQEAGPIWDWCRGIKGLKSGKLTAQLLAQIDDINQFDTVAKLWRFAGWGLDEDKKPDRRKTGKPSNYNGKLKGICWNIGDQFIRQQTPHYVDIYYAEKERQRQLHPKPIEVPTGKKKDGEEVFRTDFTDSHIHNRALRKMIKEFLKDLWVEWKRYELTSPS